MLESYESFINESLADDVRKAIKNVEKGGGNPENLREYGLGTLADHIDHYSKGSRGDEIIYSDKTVKAFKTLVAAMAHDEITNNQSEEW